MSSLDPPDRLSPAERNIWIATIAQVMEAGLIDRLDPNSLTAYVSAVATHQRATTLLARTDIVVERDGKPVPNPALAIQRDAAQVIAAFARQFRLNHPGLGAAMRSREPAAGHEAAACRRCGQVHDPKRCDGHNRQGVQCRKPRGERTDHLGYGLCGYHGGATPSGRQAAAKERARAVLYKRAAAGEVRAVTNPLRVLAELTGEAVAWKDAIAGMVNELPLLYGPDHNGDERLRVLVPLLERAMRTAGDLAAEMVRLNIFDRMATISQEQAAAMKRAIDAVLGDLQLSEAQWKLVPEVVPARMRELEAG